MTGFELRTYGDGSYRFTAEPQPLPIPYSFIKYVSILSMSMSLSSEQKQEILQIFNKKCLGSFHTFVNRCQ